MEIKNSKTNLTKKYFYEISFIRAIACLCVVMVHVTAGYYHESGNTFNWMTQFLNQISRYGTPAFAIISGFLLYNQAIKRSFKFNIFWKSRINKVIIPFLIWSILYLLLKWYYSGFSLPDWNSSEEVKSFLYLFFTGGSYYHLYFIAVVVQFYLLFPLLQFLKSKKYLLLFTIISVFINYFFVENKINIGSGLFNQFINNRVFILHWLYYFFLGGLLVYYWESIISWVNKNKGFSLLLGLIVMVGGIFEYHFTEWIASNRAMNMFNLPILFIALAGLYSLFPTSSNFWMKARNNIVEIGNLSMGIYLVHPMIIFFLRRYEIFSFLYDRTRYLPIVFLLILISSIVLVKIIVKLPFGSYIMTVAGTKRVNKPNVPKV